MFNKLKPVIIEQASCGEDVLLLIYLCEGNAFTPK